MRYYLTNFYKSLRIGLSLLAGGFLFIIAIAVADAFLFFSIYLVLLGVGLIWFLSRDVQHEYLVVSEHICSYHRFGAVFEVKWKNVKKPEYRWHLDMLSRQECLIIDKQNIKIKKMAFWGRWYTRRAFNLQETFIPVACFADNWRDSKLGQQIKEYAPHLFN